MKHRRIFIGLLLGLTLLLPGCESIDRMLNSESDKKINRDDTLMPSEFGILKGRLTESPVLVRRMGVVDTDLMHVKPILGDARRGNQTLAKDPEGGTELTRADDSGGVRFATVFPGRNPEERMRIDLTADNLNINAIIAQFAGAMKFNFTTESGVTGAVSASLHADVSLTEAWDIFNEMLWMCNAYCEFRNSMLHIRPLSAVGRSAAISVESGNVMIKSVRMKYVSADAMLAQVAPFLSSPAAASRMAFGNELLLVDTPNNINRVLDIINELDRPYKQGWSRVILQTKNTPAKRVIDELKRVLPVLGFQVYEGGQVDSTAGAIHLACIERLQVIIASASAVEPLAEMRRWTEVLDSPYTTDEVQVYTYNVVNSDARQLLRELAVLFPNLRGTVIPANGVDMQTVNGVQVNQTETAIRAANSVYDTPISIGANMEYNRLIISAPPQAMSMIRAILARIDTVPPQIMLEVMLVEIELGDSNSFGIEWGAQATINGQKMNFGTDYVNQDPKSDAQFGGKIHVFDPEDKESKFLYIRALAGKSRFRVASSPQVLVRSQSEAKISVGREIPITVSTLNDITSTSTTETTMIRSYTYKNVGTTMTVTPTISEGGLIDLKINQTISDTMPNTTSTIDNPVIKSDTFSTHLLLRSGRTILMGGMIRDRQEERLSSIPWIIDIPMLNWLTGDSSRLSDRTEILVLITATLVTEETELVDMVRRYSDSLREINIFENNIYAPYTRKRNDAIDAEIIKPKPPPREDSADITAIVDEILMLEATMERQISAPESDPQSEPTTEASESAVE